MVAAVFSKVVIQSAAEVEVVLAVLAVMLLTIHEVVSVVMGKILVILVLQ